VRVLLTGKNGQVGSELARLLAPSCEVTATDRASLDLAHADAIRHAVRESHPDVIVNAAAYNAVDRAESEQDVAFAVNTKAVGVLAEEAKRLDALLVHFSTDYVFDGEKRSPYVETDAPNPLGIYGRSKLEGERAAAASGCDHLVLRTSWVFGAHGASFVRAILRAAREGKALRVVSDQVGLPTSAAALARAVAQLLTAHASGWGFPGGLYHASSSGEAVSRSGYARAILAEAGIDAPIDEVSSDEYAGAARRPNYSVLDSSKLHRTFGIALPDWRAELRAAVRAIH